MENVSLHTLGVTKKESVSRHRDKRLSFVGMVALAMTAVACDMGARERPPDLTDAGTDTVPTIHLDTPDLLEGWDLTWAKAVGGVNYDGAADMATDGSDLFATGWFSFDTTFGQGEENETTLYGAGGMMYLARYRKSGELAWVAWGGDGYTVGYSVDARADGTSAVGGTYGPTAVFGEGEGNETVLNGVPGSSDTAFVASYAADGRLDWARDVALLSPLPGMYGEWGAGFSGVTALADGSVVASGHVAAGQAVFGAGEPGETVLESHGDWDGCIARYGEAGDLAWVVQVGGEGCDGVGSLEEAPGGGFYALGHYTGEVTLGEGEANETALSSIGEDSVFLARFAGDGALVWATDLGVDGTVNHAVGGVTILPGGDLAVLGRFEGAIQAGNADGWEWTESDGRGMFVARYTSAGERLWVSVATSADYYGTMWSAAPLSDGSLVVVGRYQGGAVFGAGGPNETALPAFGGQQDAFLASYGAGGELLWALGWGSSGLDSLSDVVVLNEGPGTPDEIYVDGEFQGTVSFGTGGGDEIPLSSYSSDYPDIVLLRFDREVPPS